MSTDTNSEAAKAVVEEKKLEEPETPSTPASKYDAYFKEGRYRLFTDVYGVFQGHSFKHNEKGRLVSRHATLESANEAAKVLMAEYDIYIGNFGSNGGLFGEKVKESRDDYVPTITKICVEELQLDRLTETEMRKLAAKHDIARSKDTSSDLAKIIYPTLEHKIHQNRRVEKDILDCLLCQGLYKEEYEADPTVIRRNAQAKMHRKKLSNPITLKQIEKKYGKDVLTHDCLSKAITEEKLHWHQKLAFGNAYNVYEREEIESIYREMEKGGNESEADNDEKTKKHSRKRKECDQRGQPPIKKSKHSR